MNESAKLLGYKNADIIVELKDGSILLVEVKAKAKDVSESDVKRAKQNSG